MVTVLLFLDHNITVRLVNSKVLTLTPLRGPYACPAPISLCDRYASPGTCFLGLSSHVITCIYVCKYVRLFLSLRVSPYSLRSARRVHCFCKSRCAPFPHVSCTVSVGHGHRFCQCEPEARALFLRATCTDAASLVRASTGA